MLVNIPYMDGMGLIEFNIKGETIHLTYLKFQSIPFFTQSVMGSDPIRTLGKHEKMEADSNLPNKKHHKSFSI